MRPWNPMLTEGAAPTSWRRPEFFIPAVYVMVAGIWAVAGEEVIGKWAGSSAWVEEWEIVHGLVFALACGVALALGLKALLRRLREESRRRIEAEHALAEELKLLAARLTDAREEEQARISRDLHDDLGQLVTALTMTQRGVERLAEGLPAGGSRTVLLERAVAARALAGQVQASIRRIASDLRPTALKQLGLASALEQEGRGLEERSGVRCLVVSGLGLEQMPEPVALALYRIGQEALTNVVRHAEATWVRVALEASGGAATLRIEDDGRGFTEGSRPALGLLGMRERAASLGGEVTVEGGPVRGTVVRARIPLDVGRPLEAAS